MKKHRLLVFGAFAALLIAATVIGCTGTGGILFNGGGEAFQFFAPKFAFVFDGDGGNTLTSFKVDASTGALTVATSGLATNVSGCCQSFIAVDPTSKFLFVPNYDTATVSVFTIAADGTLSGPTGTDVAAGTTPFFASLHPSGKFLYVANYGSDDVSTYSVGANGALTAVGSTIAAGHLPHSIIMDWQGRFLYVTHGSYYDGDTVANDTMDGFSINAQTGALTHIGTFNTGITPRGGMVDYSGQYLILADRGNDNGAGDLPAPSLGSVSVFSIGSTGALTAVAGSPFTVTGQSTTVGNGPFNVAEAIVSGTDYIVTSNLDSHDVSVFSLDPATGKLTSVTASALAGNFVWPHFVAVDTSGKFGYVVDAEGGPPSVTQVTLSNAGAPSVVGTPFTDPGISTWPAQIWFSH